MNLGRSKFSFNAFAALLLRRRVLLLSSQSDRSKATLPSVQLGQLMSGTGPQNAEKVCLGEPPGEVWVCFCCPLTNKPRKTVSIKHYFKGHGRASDPKPAPSPRLFPGPVPPGRRTTGSGLWVERENTYSHRIGYPRKDILVHDLQVLPYFQI